MEGNARKWFTPKQKAQLWERWKSWKSGHVWRTSPERLRGGIRAASIGSWPSMEGLRQHHAGGLRQRCGLRSAKRFRGALPLVGRYGESHRALAWTHCLMISTVMRVRKDSRFPASEPKMGVAL